MSRTIRQFLYGVISQFPSLKKRLAKKWYDFFVSRYLAEEILFMNYGYADSQVSDSALLLNPCDELYRYSIQLYHHLFSEINASGKDILEISSGIGGGVSYMSRYLMPKSVTAVDISEKALRIAQKRLPLPGLKFCLGESEHLPFHNERFDITINLEASLWFGSVDNFLKEVHRTLKKGGFFLYSDLRMKEQVKSWKDSILKSPFTLVKETDITENVCVALERLSESRRQYFEPATPKILWGVVKEFIALKDSDTYRSFKSRDRVYLSFVLKKKG